VRATNKYQLSIGLLFLLFGAKYYERTHDAGYTPADKSLVWFLCVFGLYLCIRAFAGFFTGRDIKADATRP